MLRRVLPVILLLMLVPLTANAAWIDPDFRFQTIETEHFAVHYHQGLEADAKKAASYAEEAYCSVGESFGWRPRERTNLVLVDSSDLANGFTTVLPYNMIYIYMVPPLADMTIGEYDNWLRVVIFHEYTHVATMDAVRGYPGAMRKIFGKPLPAGDILSTLTFFLAAPPNIFLPDWSLEGTAVWSETAYTHRGRGRSAFYEMVFRKAVQENEFLSISQMNGDVPFWPDGSAPYIYGLAMQRYITRTYGPEALKEINMGHAGRFPYFINAVPKRVTGRDYVQLYYDMVDSITREQGDKLATIESIPLTEYKTLDIKGERLSYPRLSPDGKYLAVERHDPNGHGGIAVLDAETLEEREFIRRLPSDMSLTWGPDSNTLCYSQADLRGGYNLYQDIYCYNVEDEDTQRITKDRRLKDPAISPDGATMAAVEVSAQSQSLVLLPLKEKPPKPEKLSSFPGMRVSSPGWSPDGKRIVYSVRDAAGNTGLRIHDIDSGSDEGVYASNAGADFPVWAPDGKYIIFTSYQTGVFNIFALRVDDHQLFQVTNLTGGAFHPDVTADGRILFSNYNGKGFEIDAMDYRPMDWSTEIGPTIEPYWPENSDMPFEQSCTAEETDTAGSGESNDDPPKTAAEVSAPEKYNAFKSAWPRFWVPTLRADNNGLVAGAFTAGIDVLGYHTFWGDVGVGNTGQGYYDLAYIYDRWYPTFRLQAFAEPLLYSDVGPNEDKDVWQKSSGAIASVSFPLKRLEVYSSLELGYILRKDHTLEGDDPLLFQGRRDSPYAALVFTDALRYPYSISHEEGRTLRLEYRDFNRDRNSDFTASQYWLTYEEYIGLPGHHVLYYRIKGAATKGDGTYVPYYLFGGTPAANDEFSLRGYPSGYRHGEYAATVTLEHRFPAWYIFKGPSTKPIFFDSLHVAGFIDAGTTWNEGDKVSGDDIDVGVGTELRSDIVLGYKFVITPALGVAFGLNHDGESQAYITVYAPF